jgi:hypothetical protein
MTATADQRAAQTDSTITINVSFVNKNKEEDNFENHSRHDYDGTTQLVGRNLTTALDEIFYKNNTRCF